jgi:hypothetical protein
LHLDVGKTLRSARTARGETLEQASHFTCIRIPYLKDLESDDFSSFDSYPGRVYGRFFLREYADHLGLDAQSLLRRFDRDAEPVLQPAPPPPISRRIPHPGRWAVAALILLMVSVTAGAIGSHQGQPPLAPVATNRGVVPVAPAPVEAQAPVRAVAHHGIRAVIRTNTPCWIRAVVDGSTVMEKTVPTGRTVRLRASETRDLRLGNAGGVALSVNGRSIPTGEAGNVQDLSFVRRGGRVVIA